MKKYTPLAAVAGALLLAAGCVTDNYPISTCVMSGKALGSMGKPVVYVHIDEESGERTTVKFCCANCEAPFKEDPDVFLAKLANLADGYTRQFCLVNEDTKLGEMGKPFVYNHKGTTVKFCCKGCLADFQKEPEKFLAKLKAKPAPKPEE